MVRFKDRTILLLLFSVLFILGSQHASYAQILYDYYGIEHGLKDRLVTDIVFDERGLVWVGSSNGLSRFDGHEFYHFIKGPKAIPEQRLSQSGIEELALSEDNQILIFYQDLYSSFDVIDPLTFRVNRVEISLKTSGDPRGFFVNHEGQLFVVTKGEQFTEFYYYDSAENAFVSYVRIADNWPLQRPNIEFVVTPDGQIVVFDKIHGLRSIDVAERVPQAIAWGNEDVLGIEQLHFLHLTSSGKVLLAMTQQSGVWEVDVSTSDLKLLDGLNGSMQYARMYEDASGNLLFNHTSFTGNFPKSLGWYCIQPSGKVSNFKDLLDVSEYVTVVTSKDFFRSSFFGTDTGMKVAQNTTTKIDTYLAQKLKEDRRGFSMRGIVDDGGRYIYFGREVNAWYRLDKETDIVDTLILNGIDGYPLAFSNCQGMTYDSTGYLWGLTGNGQDLTEGWLHRYDVYTCTNEIFIYDDPFYAIADAVDSTLWIGSYAEDGEGQLLAFDTSAHTFTAFVDTAGVNPFAQAKIRFIYPSQDAGTMWVGTEQGLFWIDTENRSFAYFHKNEGLLNVPGQSVNLSSNVIYAIYETPDRDLWLGTANGLTYWDRNRDTWAVYRSKDGLTADAIASVIPYKDGLWIGTYYGLAYHTPGRREGEWRRFFRIDGIAHNEFNRLSALKDYEGKIYLGGVNGVNAFFPEELLQQQEINAPILAAIRYFDSDLDSNIVQVANLADMQQIIIEPEYQYFSLDFSLPIYTPTTANKFRYKIAGSSNNQWIELKNSRSLNLGNIKAGRYTYYVAGGDPNGNWGIAPLRIDVVAKQYWYQTTLFAGCAFVALGLLVFFVLRYRLTEKLRMERLRTQLASDLHDEVSGLLAGISMQSELVRSQVEDEQLSEKISRIRDATQKAMSKMSDVIWSIDARRDRFSDLISRMQEHADEVLLPINIRYRLRTHELDEDKAIPANVRQNLYFIYKEAINNVAKHAVTSNVDIVIGHEGPYFEMLIKDNGQEMVSKLNGKQRKGQGMTNLKMRAQRLNAELRVLRGRGYIIHLQMKRFA